MLGKRIVVARVFRRGHFRHIGKHTLASEEASYKIAMSTKVNGK
jgi:hypothetical protein